MCEAKMVKKVKNIHEELLQAAWQNIPCSSFRTSIFPLQDEFRKPSDQRLHHKILDNIFLFVNCDYVIFSTEIFLNNHCHFDIWTIIYGTMLYFLSLIISQL